MTPLHVLAGLLALLAGAVALSARKGGELHRKSGLVFVGAMVVMTSSAFVIAVLRMQKINMVAAP
jgi:uncharacterized membrane protein